MSPMVVREVGRVGRLEQLDVVVPGGVQRHFIVYRRPAASVRFTCAMTTVFSFDRAGRTETSAPHLRREGRRRGARGMPIAHFDGSGRQCFPGGNSGEPGPTFASGIATNYGGTWHQLSTAGLPNRYISGVTVDPSDPAHAYAIFNGYARQWIPGGGVGHVFETDNGGRTWADISTNLPDIASDALVIDHGQLALATDLGVDDRSADRRRAALARDDLVHGARLPGIEHRLGEARRGSPERGGRRSDPRSGR